MSLVNKIQQVKAHIDTIEKNLKDLEDKNRKSAAPKARASIQSVRGILTVLRKDIMVTLRDVPITRKNVGVKMDPTREKIVVMEQEPEQVEQPKPKRKYTKKIKVETELL